MKTVADQFTETLVTAGVKRIYGIVGASLNGLADAIRRQGKFEWLHVRHEEVAAFAAGAEAHLSGSMAVCAGSCSPGNPHLINALFDCHRSHVPVLTIAAHLFRQRSHYCELVSNARQMPRTLEIAIREAVSKRGVSAVMIPGDVALQEATPAALAVSEGLLPRPATIVPDAGSLTRLAALLNEVERVTTLCGSGCEVAHYELVGLGERLYMVKAVLNGRADELIDLARTQIGCGHRRLGHTRAHRAGGPACLGRPAEPASAVSSSGEVVQ